MKLGVVDVGGGLRGIYAAGVFDYCLDAEPSAQGRNAGFAAK